MIDWNYYHYSYIILADMTIITKEKLLSCILIFLITIQSCAVRGHALAVCILSPCYALAQTRSAPAQTFLIKPP